ncbi:MAG: Sec-independent protein translocase subunit TatA [Gammaproteobacteria bacterium]
MSFGIWELAIILAIVALLFGTKKLRSIGTDMGGAIKGFRAAMNEEKEPTESAEPAEQATQAPIIEGEVEQPAEKDPGTH